ncbi:MAG: hypothetical protein GF341_00390, partial [candidate division Zixibacteria bacterium]|nr:hypothetical protein [candidate division Zixibacteria bacterium]
ELYDGEHRAIIEDDLFNRAQEIVGQNGSGSGPAVRNTHGALLKGLLRCGQCGAAMAHTYTSKKGKLYRYYVCNTRQKQGKGACDTPSLSAPDVEDFVVEQIKQIGKDPKLVEQVYREAQRQQKSEAPKLESEYDKLYDERLRKTAEINSMVQLLADATDPMPTVTGQLREAEGLVERMDGRLHELKQRIADLKTQTIGAEHLREALEQFDPVWNVLQMPERIALVREVVESVAYTGGSGDMKIRLYSLTAS